MTLRREIPQTQAMIDRYGRINGDNDIIHYDRDYALARGFRGTLNHGMMTMGYVAELGARKFGRDWFYRGELQVKWTGPVCPGDTLVVEAGDDGEVRAEVEAGPVASGRMGLRGPQPEPGR